MRTLLVACHPMTGGTEQMEQAAGVLAADAHAFATPENLAAIAGRMKDFFDRCDYPALERISGRPSATLAGPFRFLVLSPQHDAKSDH